MDVKKLVPGSKYILQHGTQRVLAKIAAIKTVIKTDFSGNDEETDQLEINAIGRVNLKLAKPLFYDAYADNKANGSFILIDPQSNHTSGVGFIQ